MNRKAFTLIELLISVFLLGLIINFLYSAVANLQKTNIMFYNKSSKLQKNEKILDLIYNDIFLANSIKIAGRKNSSIDLKTSNSIYDIDSPYVSWVLSKRDNMLLRFESTQKFTDMTSDNKHLYHVTNVAINCERFHIYQSKDKNNILIDIKLKDQKRLVYEFFKPMQVETNTTKRNLLKTN
jgi:prepilin-type N-terminal cleavage/methylation domain-containing protein